MTLSINGKTYEAGELIAYVKKLEQENAELKKKLKEKLKTIADKDLSFVAKFDALEKENAELKEENKTVSKKANEAIADKLLITAKYNEVLNDLNQENDKLQKKNAELKERLKEHESVGDVQFWENVWDWKIKAIHLTKAKDIIKRYLTIGVGGKITQNYLDVTKEAEQFLKECK